MVQKVIGQGIEMKFKEIPKESSELNYGKSQMLFKEAIKKSGLGFPFGSELLSTIGLRLTVNPETDPKDFFDLITSMIKNEKDKKELGRHLKNVGDSLQ